MAENKRHRSFSTKPKDGEKPIEPPTFDLNDQTFTGRPRLPGAVILGFISSADEEGGAVAKQLLGFFDSALEPESLERFTKVINDPDEVVELETLSEIVGWLIEQYTSRPTAAS